MHRSPKPWLLIWEMQLLQITFAMGAGTQARDILFSKQRTKDRQLAYFPCTMVFSLSPADKNVRYINHCTFHNRNAWSMIPSSQRRKNAHYLEAWHFCAKIKTWDSSVESLTVAISNDDTQACHSHGILSDRDWLSSGGGTCWIQFNAWYSSLR